MSFADRYRRVFAVPSLAQAVTGVGIVAAGSSARVLAVVLLVQDATGSYAVAGAAAGASALGAALVAPVRGRVVDRFGQARVLVPMAVVHALAWVLVAVAAGRVGGATLVVLSLFGGAAFPPVYACIRSAIALALRGDDALNAGFAVNAMTQNVATVGGPVIGAVVVAASSPAVALVVTAGLTLSGTLIFSASRAARILVGHGTAGLPSPIRGGGVLALVAAMVAYGGVVGALEVVIPAAALGTSTTLAAGILLACFAFGDIGGSLLYGGLSWSRTRAAQAALASAAACATIAAAAAAADRIVLLAVLLVCAGAATAPITISAFGLVDEVSDERTATEAFTWIASGQLGGIAAGAVVAGAIVEHAGVRLGFAAAAASAIFGGAVFVGLRLALRRGAAAPVGEISTPTT